MLNFLDILLTLVHLIVIGFNLTGWIFPATRRLHLIFIAVTAFSWFILGIWFGTGYCPITDWQWRVKERLGETGLPGSFITYFVNKITGLHFSDSLVNVFTLVFFLLAALISVYYNLKSKNGSLPVHHRVK